MHDQYISVKERSINQRNFFWNIKNLALPFTWYFIFLMHYASNIMLPISELVWQLTIGQRTEDSWTVEVFCQNCSSAYNSCNSYPMGDCHTNIKSSGYREEHDTCLDGWPTDCDRMAVEPSVQSDGRQSVCAIRRSTSRPCNQTAARRPCCSTPNQTVHNGPHPLKIWEERIKMR